MPPALDLTGQRFGRLVAREPCRVGNRRGWLCDCDCGRQKRVETAKLTHQPKPIVQSCGCLERENRQRQAVHHPAARIDLHCPGCGRVVIGHPNRRYCSATCKTRIARGSFGVRHCRLCGAEYQLVPGQTRKREWCSQQCRKRLRSIYRQQHNRGTLADQAATITARIQESS